MRAVVEPGRPVGGAAAVPGDKSIAHRWLILAATASGRSRLEQVPASLDVRATAACMARVAPAARPSLEDWLREAGRAAEAGGFTWHGEAEQPASPQLEVEGEGRRALEASPESLDCANSGTTMRLLAGVLASAPFRSVLDGDPSLRVRPMERIAAPLRAMGAGVTTTDGHAPLEIRGASLTGLVHELTVPSAQVKGALLLAGLAAEGRTEVREPAATRDHTERALSALGAPVEVGPGRVGVEAHQHPGFEARVPGDPSSAAFLVAAAAITGGELEVRGVGLNPTRTRFLEVMRRMGVHTETRTEGEELGEPVGSLIVAGAGELTGTTIAAEELPLVIDEVPVLAAVAGHARGESWFLGAGELRVKESDRLGGLADGLVALGGHAGVEGDDLVIAGGGLRGGSVDARGDHRMAMAFAVAGLGAEEPVRIDGFESAAVSFPGFAGALRGLGAAIEPEG